MSQRLRRAAEDLKRMQAEYEELQMQVHRERGENPSSSSGTTAQPTNDHTSGAVGRFSSHTTRSSLFHHPGSFRHGHRNPRHDDTNYFKRQQPQQPSPSLQGGGREHREKRQTGEERIEQCSPILLSSSGEETQYSLGEARYETSTRRYIFTAFWCPVCLRAVI